MSQVEYIDLSECDDNPTKSLNVSTYNGLTFKLIDSTRPKCVALKCIGLSLIKLQYGEKYIKTPQKTNDQNGNVKPNIFKTNIWYSVWLDGQKSIFIQYPVRHMLEQKYEKNNKCPFSRSLFCYLPKNMSRINWIHHMRRGHVRINHHWKQALKQNPQTETNYLFQVFCVLCSKSRKFLPITPQEFVQHMIKTHPNFMPYDDYLAYFQRCYICSDDTDSFYMNLNHRHMCLTAVTIDPNQFGTINFNKCFKSLQGKSLICLEPETELDKSFEHKLKTYKYFKRTILYHWLARKRNELRQLNTGPAPIQTPSDPYVVRSYSVNAPSNGSVDLTRFQTVPKPTPSWESSSHISESKRVCPGSIQTFTNRIRDRFFIPVPFPMKDETTFKNMYPDWVKRIATNNEKLVKVNPWYCELCNAMIRNTSMAYSHIRICHKDVHFRDYQCKSCDKRFITTQGYKLHFQETKRCPVARKCGICNISVSVNDIYRHLFTKHQNNFNKVLQLTVCLICRNNITDLWRHLLDIHGICSSYPGGITRSSDYSSSVFFNCHKCDFTFFSDVELRNHLITKQHHFECKKCPELRFYAYWELLFHKESKHKFEFIPRRLSCELCPLSWSSELCRTAKIEFVTTSDKVEHFIECHNIDNCVVLLAQSDMVLPDEAE